MDTNRLASASSVQQTALQPETKRSEPNYVNRRPSCLSRAALGTSDGPSRRAVAAGAAADRDHNVGGGDDVRVQRPGHAAIRSHDSQGARSTQLSRI